MKTDPDKYYFGETKPTKFAVGKTMREVEWYIPFPTVTKVEYE